MRCRAALVLVAVLALAGCTATPAPSPTADERPTATTTTSPPPRSTPTPTPTPTDALAGMTLEERVGQLFMVGTPVERASRATLRAVRDRHAGSVFFAGRSSAEVEAIAEVTERFTSLARRGAGAKIPLWIATDQEGGTVQVLSGPGFSDIPYAIRQADRSAPALKRSAARWGRELREAGVNMNLAPVADIVTSADVRFDNAPIGALGRQYGYDAQTVARKAGAFADGMRSAGVMPTFKHFPGLGRVAGNTDTSRNVHDTKIGPDSPDVEVYVRLTGAGPSVVMVSSAVYEKIDPTQPAMFSDEVVEGVLRDRVGFDGVVITDDVSAARAVTDIRPRERAVRAIEAGADLVLVSADASVFPEMYDAVLARAKKDADFAERVDESARRVVHAKAELPGP